MAKKTKTTKTKRKVKKKTEVKHVRGKRKEAIARATIKEGSGKVRINSKLLEAFEDEFIKEIIREPVAIAGADAVKVDIEVNVKGGGIFGQAQASRTAIAKALSEYFGESLTKRYEEIDKYLLAEDSRRVESKKYAGPKARARYQKSYR
ncbi:30S ribosomal protein S9 [Candidatus Micrarchaeota archaeon]|nr:30S ribosomal protein S9 [Candidatus Micrarchaeota archaeon]